MPNSTTLPPTPATDDENTETRMRLALGLRGPGGAPPQQRADQARARHKFVQDGGVPVVMLNSGSRGEADSAARARLQETEAQLESERAAHGATRRMLQEANTTIQGLKTRLAHTELAHQDALAAAARAAEALLAPPPELAPTADKPARAPRKPAISRMAKPPREPKPVKWWTPGYRARK